MTLFPLIYAHDLRPRNHVEMDVMTIEEGNEEISFSSKDDAKLPGGGKINAKEVSSNKC